MDKFGITRACVSSMMGIQYDFRRGNREVHDEAAKFPGRFIPFCVVHPRYWSEAEPELLECVTRFGFRGLALHPTEHVFAADCLSARRIVGAAQSLGIPVAIHSSEEDLAHPNRIGALAAAFPSTTFIMYHMGRFAWQEAIEVASERLNILLDTTDASCHDGLVEKAAERVGAERVVWGSGLPVSYPGPNLTRILIARLSERERELVLGKNVAKLFETNRA